MTRIVNVHEAKTHLSRLLDEVHAGEDIILAKAGRPYARLIPFERNAGREVGFLPELHHLGDRLFDPLAEDELAAYEENV